MTTTVVDLVDDVLPWTARWDALAVDASRPYCAPGWMLPWFRNEAPAGARLRAVVVHEADRLVAIAPFVAEPVGRSLTRYRLLASTRGTPIEPLADGGDVRTAAAEFSRVFERLEPRPDLLTLEGATPVWTRAIADAQRASHRWTYRRDRTTILPFVDLSGRTFDEWFSSKSRNFQQQMRRSERKLAREGFEARVLRESDDVHRAIDALGVQHLRRWDGRGGSRVWRRTTPAMLRDAARTLGPQGRFRVITLERDGDIISSHVFVGAGRALSYWLGSFDEAWAQFKPSMVAIVAAIRDAAANGYDRIDLGQGEHAYKLRFTADRDQLEWMTLVPPGLSGVRTMLHLAPGRGARALIRRIPDGVRSRARERFKVATRTP